MGTSIMRAASISVQRCGICGCYIDTISKQVLHVSDGHRRFTCDENRADKKHEKQTGYRFTRERRNGIRPRSHLHCVFCFPILLWKQKKTKTKVSSIDFNGFQFGSVC